jgi:lysophospholipid acyltransferase (LPLAT)-like uncharacterized protein
VANLEEMSVTSPRLREPCREGASRATPARKRFSLTRARRSGERLSGADGLRAAIFSGAARSAIWVIERTMRLRTVDEAVLGPSRRLGPGGLLFALWHCDYFPIFSYARGSGVCVVVSRSPDGEILARVLNQYGYRTVRGSGTRGATRAMIELARVVAGGCDGAVAVDGPKGPAGQAKPGIVLLAKITGCPIVPLGAGMSRFKQFASWDRFRLPLPFSRVVLTAGEAIQVPPDASTDLIELKRCQLEQSLRDQQLRAGDTARKHFARADLPLGFASSRAPADGGTVR